MHEYGRKRSDKPFEKLVISCVEVLVGLQRIGQNGEGVHKHSTTTCALALIHLTYVGVTGGGMIVGHF